MFITAPLIAALAFAQAEAPITLSRTFVKGQKLNYEFKSNLHEESRELGLQTWLPSDVDISYNFTFEVKELKNDGFAKILYKRPSMTIVDGENALRGPRTTVEKVNQILEMTLSPMNEITELKDLTPKKPEKKKPAEPAEDERVRQYARKQGELATGLVESLTSGMTRLMLFLGSLESSLDFAPRLPFDELKVGDTWKRTVGYSPQKLAGKEGKMASQRMDFTYTYKGLVKSGNVEVHRVEAALQLDTNLADFMNQQLPDELRNINMLTSMPFKLNAHIVFDLDKKTCNTVKAVATGESTSQIFLKGTQDAVDETKMKSKATLRLISQSVASPSPAAKAKPKAKTSKK